MGNRQYDMSGLVWSWKAYLILGLHRDACLVEGEAGGNGRKRHVLYMIGWDIDHLIKTQQIKSQSRRRRAETEMKNDTVPNKMPADLQSFPEAIYESLEQGLIVGNGLEYVSIGCHVSDGPLAQPRTAQSEDVTEERHIVTSWNKFSLMQICRLNRAWKHALGNRTWAHVVHDNRLWQIPPFSNYFSLR